MSRPVIYGGAIRNRGARDGGAERARGRADLGGRGVVVPARAQVSEGLTGVCRRMVSNTLSLFRNLFEFHRQKNA